MKNYNDIKHRKFGLELVKNLDNLEEDNNRKDF